MEDDTVGESVTKSLAQETGVRFYKYVFHVMHHHYDFQSVYSISWSVFI